MDTRNSFIAGDEKLPGVEVLLGGEVFVGDAWSLGVDGGVLEAWNMEDSDFTTGLVTGGFCDVITGVAVFASTS